MNTQTQQQKKPSYLEEVKDELLKLILSDHATSDQDAQEITESLWTLIRPKLTQSYYNGVRDGASGKVKPKEYKNSQAKS